jgi:lysophospholipase L1-like esterase
MKTRSYLALGDSYTIGEQVPLYESFPYQFNQLQRDFANKSSLNITYSAPEIIAKTGWTTDELEQGIASHLFDDNGYDLVTLLIGVNNQYRGRTAETYAFEFEALLNKAIIFARGEKQHVYVLSIPDWGLTPFAKDRNAAEISSAIDVFNFTAQNIAERYGVDFIDITTDQRKDAVDESFIASDGLHPSGKEYKKWASKLFEKAKEQYS